MPNYEHKKLGKQNITPGSVVIYTYLITFNTTFYNYLFSEH